MEEAVMTMEREGKRGTNPNSLANLTARGRPPGTPNKVNKTIREAVLEAVQPGMCHPDGLKGWLIDRAHGGIEDRKVFAAVISRVIPIEITGEGGGPVKIDLGWLTGRKVGGGEVIDITPATQNDGEQEAARLSTDFQSEAPLQTPAPMVARRSKAKARKGESE